MENIIVPLYIFMISTFLISQSVDGSSVYIDSQLKQCSSMITIYSSGPSYWVQGSVLGTYLLKDETIQKWPTWKMKNRGDRFLYKCPCGKKWLFGRANGRVKDGLSTQIARIAPKIALGSGNTGMMMKNNGIRTRKLESEKEKRMIRLVIIYGWKFKIFLPGSQSSPWFYSA